MKSLTFRKLIFSLSLFGLNATAKDSLKNYSAYVEIDSNEANDFATRLLILSSMPLQGSIVSSNFLRHSSTVRVDIYPEYARANQLDSFDVAKKMESFVGNPYHIRKITAQVAPTASVPDLVDEEEDLSSNVGTIGHR